MTLTIHSLSAAYGDLPALWDVSLQVEAGKIVALIGPNGAGKTTLLRTIVGLHRASAGSIHFHGNAIHTIPAHQLIEQGIALVPEGRRLFGGMSVLENLQVGAHCGRARLSAARSLKQVFEVFPVLRERQHSPAATLSGGMQQMLAIGRALMGVPRLLLLDELSLGLAPLIVQNMFEVVTQVNRAGMTVLLAVDIFIHHRVERYAGVNVWGYRGPSVGKKRTSEHRIVVLGGSTVLGYGVNWDQAFPAQLEANLRALSRNGAPVSVVNLGMNAQGVYSFRFTLEDYLYLAYDAAVFYEGYNDLASRDVPNSYVARRDSPIFRLTGYYPIAPIFLREKAMLLRSGGDINAAYRDDKTVFRPGLATRTSASALEAAARIGQTLDEQLERLAKSSAVRGAGVTVKVSDVGCDQWTFYCGAVYDGIQVALAHGKKVLVVTQPYIHPPHPEQQAALRSMLRERFGRHRDVGYVDLGRLVDVNDLKMCYDTMHLTPEGNALLASRLVAPIADLMPDAFTRPADSR